MKQYRITSDHFVHQGETGDDNAVMHPDDLAEIKRLAGLPITEAEAGVYTGQNTVPQASENGIESPVGSNISYTAGERNALCKEYNAKPGDELWFIIMFTKPYLNGSLRNQVDHYIKTHPKSYQKPRPLPGN